MQTSYRRAYRDLGWGGPNSLDHDVAPRPYNVHPDNILRGGRDWIGYMPVADLERWR